MTTSAQRAWWAGAVLLVWLASTAVLFWYVQFRPLRWFDDTGALSQRFATLQEIAPVLKQALREAGLPPIEGATMVHFSEPGCACNRYSEDHVRELTDRYRRLGFESWQVQPTRTSVPASAHSKQPYFAVQQTALQNVVPAAPAVAVFDHAGQLAYFGPYSAGIQCGPEDSLVDTVLNALTRFGTTGALRLQEYGCYCAWPTEPNSAVTPL